MLVLTRRVGESVRIGDEVTITILDIRGDIARVGITAPRAIAVHRDEVFRELSAVNREAVADDNAATALARALRSRHD